MQGRRFAVVIVFKGLRMPSSEAGVATLEYLIRNGREVWSQEAVERSLTDEDYIIIEFTADEFIDYGFEVLAAAVEACVCDPFAGLNTPSLLSVVDADACWAFLFWKDGRDGQWRNAARSRSQEFEEWQAEIGRRIRGEG